MNVRVLFIDRDGTLIEEPEDCQVDALEKVRLVPDVIPALRALRDHGYRFVMVSNQDGLGTPSFPAEQFDRCQRHVLHLFGSQGIAFDEIFICPHTAEAGCDCRKPRTGLLTAYLAATSLDLERSAVVGDRDTDLELARRIGVRGFRLGNGCGSWSDVVEALCFGERRATVRRSTRETTVCVSVNLDVADRLQVTTGIGFFDHMLEQIAKHAGFALTLTCDGDLGVDEHHSVEDAALSLGQALREALGDKRGIGRYGFVLPMDETEVRASLDLSGRPYFVFCGAFPRDAVGGLSTEMVVHFFRSFAESLGAALHLEVRGDNTHHMVEGCFKAVGRCLRQALRVEGRDLPSTKGVL